MEKLWKPVNLKVICLIKLSTNSWLSLGGLNDSWGGGRCDPEENYKHDQHSKAKGKYHEMLKQETHFQDGGTTKIQGDCWASTASLQTT